MIDNADQSLSRATRAAFDDLNHDIVATLARLTPARRLGMVSDLADAARHAYRIQARQCDPDGLDETIELAVSERMLADGGVSPAVLQRIRQRRR